MKTAVHDDQVYYLQEHASEFPGVQIQQTYLRDYPYQSLAAQVLGYVGEISPQELKAKQQQKADYRMGDKIGKSGVEATLDGYLRGVSGAAQIRVDSLGRPQGPLEIRRDARPGTAVRLTLDIKLQRAAERAIRYGIQLARDNKQYNAGGGAIIALDPRDGAVRAMASYPTYKPSVYVGRIDPEKLAPLVNNAAAKEANFPGLNRVTQVAYPPGSTWKPVTALAAMQEHILSPYSSIQCTGEGRVRPRQAGVQELGPVREPPHDPARGARDLVRHVLLRRRQPLLRGRRRDAHPAPGLGAAGSASAPRPGSTSATRRPPGRRSCRRPPGGRRRSRATGTRRGTPATRSSSRSARRTSP